VLDQLNHWTRGELRFLHVFVPEFYTPEALSIIKRESSLLTQGPRVIRDVLLLSFFHEIGHDVQQRVEVRLHRVFRKAIFLFWAEVGQRWFFLKEEIQKHSDKLHLEAEGFLAWAAFAEALPKL